jgi:hypothetical protein
VIDFLLTRESDLLTLVLSFDVANQPARKRRYTEKQEKKWDEMYAELCSYHKEHGHCIVKYHDENYEALANWVSLQRLNYRQGSMDETRQERLHDLNFTWIIQQR